MKCSSHPTSRKLFFPTDIDHYNTHTHTHKINQNTELWSPVSKGHYSSHTYSSKGPERFKSQKTRECCETVSHLTDMTD